MASRKTKWDIRNDGRAWSKDEAFDRYLMLPRKIEVIKGKLLFSRKDRERLLVLLLENVGADRVVQIGDAEIWRAAVAKLPR